MRIVHDKTVITKSIWREKDDDKLFVLLPQRLKGKLGKKKRMWCAAERQMNMASLYSFVVRIFLMSLDMKGEGTKLLFFLLCYHKKTYVSSLVKSLKLA